MGNTNFYVPVWFLLSNSNKTLNTSADFPQIFWSDRGLKDIEKIRIWIENIQAGKVATEGMVCSILLDILY